MVKILIVSACGNERSKMLAASLAFSESIDDELLLRPRLDRYAAIWLKMSQSSPFSVFCELSLGRTVQFSGLLAGSGFAQVSGA